MNDEHLSTRTPIEGYCYEMQLARRRYNSIHGNWEDALQNVTLELLKKNQIDKLAHIGFVNTATAHRRIDSYRESKKQERRRIAFNDLRHASSACVDETEDHPITLEQKKMALAVAAIPKPEFRHHINERFFRDTPRAIIKSEGGFKGLMNHDGYVTRGLNSIRNIWAAFEYFTEEQIWKMEKLDFLTVAEVGKIMGIHKVTVVKYINLGLIRAIAIGKPFYIERSWIPTSPITLR